MCYLLIISINFLLSIPLEYLLPRAHCYAPVIPPDLGVFPLADWDNWDVQQLFLQAQIPILQPGDICGTIYIMPEGYVSINNMPGMQHHGLNAIDVGRPDYLLPRSINSGDRALGELLFYGYGADGTPDLRARHLIAPDDSTPIALGDYIKSLQMEMKKPSIMVACYGFAVGVALPVLACIIIKAALL